MTLKTLTYTHKNEHSYTLSTKWQERQAERHQWETHWQIDVLSHFACLCYVCHTCVESSRFATHPPLEIKRGIFRHSYGPSQRGTLWICSKTARLEKNTGGWGLVGVYWECWFSLTHSLTCIAFLGDSQGVLASRRSVSFPQVPVEPLGLYLLPLVARELC